IGAGPLHYEDEAGEWRDIVTTLVPGGEPGVSSPLATKADVEFGPEIRGDSAAILSGEDWSIGIDMLGASENLKIAMGNEVRYLGVAEDATLLYEALNEGIKETVVLSGPGAPDRYEFAMALDGLEIRQQPGGGYLFYRSDTYEPVAELGELVVFDSAGPGSVGAQCPDAAMTVEACGDTAYVSYDIPRAWLDDPARVYQVSVDPTVFLRDADATPCPDTFGCEGKPTTNYSTATYLSVGNGANGQTYSYVKFPHFGTRVPAGAFIYYADFGLYQTLGTASSVHYGRVDASWSAGLLTWNNKPAHTYLGIKTAGGIGKFVIFDATATAQRWASGTSANEGFAVFHMLPDA
ncbi:MAG: DNRLRE domain-containing protein, partial [Coriobacteriia bacterium]|nr:DNRLRE domain-containing protein [Coriobacteriia bacterium]